MKPLLNMINNYDATKDYVATYTYLGSNLVITNELSIREAVSGSKPVYSRQSSKFDKNHTIPKNTLKNGKTYWAKIRVKVGENWTEYSQEVSFMCLATPILKFSSFDNENYVYNDDILMQVIYRQAQGERIETYQFMLLDQNKQPLEKYPTRTTDTDSPNLMQERVRGLVRGKLYYVGVRLKTRNGIVYYEDHQFIPHYIAPTIDGIVTTSVQGDNGQILVESYLKQILGSQTKPFIEGMEIANDTAYTYWKNDWIVIPEEKPLMYRGLGMAKASDWVAKIWCQNVKNGIMLDFSKVDGGLPKVTFIKHDDYIVCEKELGGIKSRTKSNTIKGMKLKGFYLYIKVMEYRVQMTIELLPKGETA